MLTAELESELRKELDTWEAAYNNCNSMQKALAVIDAERIAMADRLEAEREIADKAARAIEGIASQMDDGDSGFMSVLEEYFGRVGAKMVVS